MTSRKHAFMAAVLGGALLIQVGCAGDSRPAFTPRAGDGYYMLQYVFVDAGTFGGYNGRGLIWNEHGLIDWNSVTTVYDFEFRGAATVRLGEAFDGSFDTVQNSGAGHLDDWGLTAIDLNGERTSLVVLVPDSGSQLGAQVLVRSEDNLYVGSTGLEITLETTPEIGEPYVGRVTGELTGPDGETHALDASFTATRMH